MKRKLFSRTFIMGLIVSTMLTGVAITRAMEIDTIKPPAVSASKHLAATALQLELAKKDILTPKETESKDPLKEPDKEETVLKIIANKRISSMLMTKSGEEKIQGRVSLYMEATPEDLEAGMIEVKGFNIAYFEVPQAMITGREPKGKPTGVLGFAMNMLPEGQYLGYDPRQKIIFGELEGRMDMAQLAETEHFQADEKDDAFITPTQNAFLKVEIALDKPLKADPTREKIQQNQGVLSFDLAADEAPGLDVQAYEILHQKTVFEVETTIFYYFEVARRLCVQPVRIMTLKWKGGFPQPFPVIKLSGKGLAFGQPGAIKEWKKADVVFTFRDWITLYSPAHMVLSSTEANALRSKVTEDDCIEVFFVDSFNPQCMWGGGATWGSGTASSQIITSDDNADWGVDFTHLAHELGHVMGLMHPGSGYPTVASPGLHDGSSGTLLCPSGCMNDNPAVNSQENESNVSNPLFTFAFKPLSPGPDCIDSADCGSCF